MNKNEFLSQLSSKLTRLPADEIKNALSYYEEYFDDAGVQYEQSVIAELGSPSDVAAKIMGEFAVKNLDKGEKTAKKGLNAIWIVILGIFTAPIALPIALATVILVFALVIVLCSLIFSFGVTAFALTISGAVTLIIGLFILSSEFATAVLLIGLGFFCIGVGLAFAMLTRNLSKTSFNGIAKAFAKLLKGRRIQ